MVLIIDHLGELIVLSHKGGVPLAQWESEQKQLETLDGPVHYGITYAQTM